MRFSAETPDEDEVDEWASDRFFMLRGISKSARLASEEVEKDTDTYKSFVKLYQWSQRMIDIAMHKDFDFKKEVKE